MPGGGIEKTFFVICVRATLITGKNDFHDEGDGTITDRATGLMWSKADSGLGMNWQEALRVGTKEEYGEVSRSRQLASPSVKELQSIVDYTRSPATTQSPAIAPIFTCTAISNEIQELDYPFYWTATTHAGPRGGAAAMYVAFGRAAGWMSSRGPVSGPPQRRGGSGPGPGSGFGPPPPSKGLSGAEPQGKAVASTGMWTSTGRGPNAAIRKSVIRRISHAAADRKAM